jgi:hypothetical protein
MNGHDEQGIAAYGPGDEMELMAAILAAHDEQQVEAWGGAQAAWPAAPHDDDPATELWRHGAYLSSQVDDLLDDWMLCPCCGGDLLPVEDGRDACVICGWETGEEQ